jgi:hypothetical protein
VTDAPQMAAHRGGGWHRGERLPSQEGDGDGDQTGEGGDRMRPEGARREGEKDGEGGKSEGEECEEGDCEHFAGSELYLE